MFSHFSFGLSPFSLRPIRPLVAAPLALVLAFVLTGCGGGSPSTPTATTSPTAGSVGTPTPTFTPAYNAKGQRVAQIGDTVEVNYTGTLDDGTVFDSSQGRGPFTFTIGSGQVISGFDKAVIGMAVGDTKTVRLAPDQAYGPYNDKLVFQLPKSSAPEGLQVGDHVQLPNGAPAVVTKITDSTVTIDANPPLAGKTLTFKIDLVAIK